MNIDQESIFYIIAAFVLGLLIKSFFPSYIKKKGENLATKEDIEHITEKIESVRSSIEINTDAHKEYVGDRKKSLINFYDEISSFHYEIMAVNFGDFPFDGGKSLFYYQQKFHKATAEILKKHQRLIIYLPQESNLLSIASSITENVIESRKVLKSNFGAIKRTVISEHEAYLNIAGGDKTEYIAAAKESDKANSVYWEKMRPLAASFIGMYQTYLSELNKYLRESEINT